MVLKRHHITSKEDIVPVVQKCGFGMGAAITVVAFNAVPLLIPLYHIKLLKMSPILLGLLVFWPRLWDAVTDPIMGSISDNTRTRFGRRRPYIALGGILVGAFFAALFMIPAHWSQSAMFFYTLLILLLFYTSMTIFMVPHGALGCELTADYHERTNVFTVSAIFGNIFGFVLSSIYYLANRPVWGGPIVGMKIVCTGFGVIFALSAIICALVCKEKKFEEIKKQPKVKLLDGFRLTCQNKSFLILVSSFVLVFLGFNVVQAFGQYILIYYIFGDNTDIASKVLMYNGWVWSGVSIIGVTQLPFISRFLGKKKTLTLAFALMLLGNLLKIVCYSQPYPYLVVIPTALLALGMVVCFSIVYSLLADICDEDELVTGKRREGMYYAVYGWWTKLAMSVAILGGGILLKYIGYDPKLELQTDSALYWLRFWEISWSVVLCGIAILIFKKYPLTEDRAYEIKGILEERRENRR